MTKIKKLGKFIVIEGVDGSGKSVQAELLKKHLATNGYKVDFGVDRKQKQIVLLEDFFEERGYRVETDDYPHYQTSVWGKLVGQMLVGEFGDPAKISPYLTVLPYMIDQYWGSQKIKRWINKGVMVISNRYFTSNVHQVVKFKGKARKDFRNWLWDAGWNQMKIYRPDLVIVLRIPPKVAVDLIKRKMERGYVGGKGVDKMEENMEHQMAAAKEYERMCKYNSDWVTVDCCNSRGELRTPKEISGDVMKEIEKRGWGRK